MQFRTLDNKTSEDDETAENHSLHEPEPEMLDTDDYRRPPATVQQKRGSKRKNKFSQQGKTMRAKVSPVRQGFGQDRDMWANPTHLVRGHHAKTHSMPKKHQHPAEQVLAISPPVAERGAWPGAAPTQTRVVSFGGRHSEGTLSPSQDDNPYEPDLMQQERLGMLIERPKTQIGVGRKGGSSDQQTKKFVTHFDQQAARRRKAQKRQRAKDQHEVEVPPGYQSGQ